MAASVQAYGGSGGRVQQAIETSHGVLPFTGTDLILVMLSAIVLLLLGAALAMYSYRRPRSE